MKILVATKEGQGVRDNDFCFVPRGEPIRLSTVCNTDRGHVDGNCGCSRSFVGLFCMKGTTTVMVCDWPIDSVGYLELVYASIRRAELDVLLGDDAAKEMGAEWASRVIDFCEPLEIGTVIEMRHEGMMERELE